MNKSFLSSYYRVNALATRAIFLSVFAFLVTSVVFASDSPDERNARNLFKDRKFLEAKNLIEQSSELMAKDENLYLLAVCELYLFNYRKSSDLLDFLTTAATSSETIKTRAWTLRMNIALETWDYPKADELTKINPRSDLSFIARQLIAIYTASGARQATENLAIKFSATSSFAIFSLCLMGESKYIYNTEHFDKMLMGVVRGSKIDGTFQLVDGLSVSGDELSSLLFYKGSYKDAEIIQLNLLNRSRLAIGPWHHKGLLRTARTLAALGDITSADALIRDANDFIIRVHGDSSQLRLWPILEKANLLRISGDASRARFLLASSMSIFPNFNHRIKFEIQKIP